MKHNDIQDQPAGLINKEALENLFNVYKTSSGDYFYNMMRTVQITGMDNMDNRFFVAYEYKAGEQWTAISNLFYGTISLWWLVAKINGYNDPFSLPSPGTRLAILKSEQVNAVLSMIRAG